MIVTYSHATEFTLSAMPASLSDWTNAAFYEGDAAPTGASTDIVKIPDGMTVTVSGTDSDVVSFLGSINMVKPTTNAFLVIDVPLSASPLEYTGQVNSDGDIAAFVDFYDAASAEFQGKEAA